MAMSKEELRNFVYVSIISADNWDLDEDVKQQIMQRYKEREGDWAYILEPIEDIELRSAYIHILS